MIEERLGVYFTMNSETLPEHILFYRDGVSESQYGMVRKEELPLIEKGCKAAGKRFDKSGTWLPKITLVCGWQAASR
jgi:eukaryotic translation initiation factor 2C